MNGLYPQHPLREEEQDEEAITDCPSFKQEEHADTLATLENKKATASDGIPSEALKAIGQIRPEVLLEMYNSCLDTGIFWTRWKNAKLVLICKGTGDPSSPSAYRQLSVLDTAAKHWKCC